MHIIVLTRGEQGLAADSRFERRLVLFSQPMGKNNEQNKAEQFTMESALLSFLWHNIFAM